MWPELASLLLLTAPALAALAVSRVRPVAMEAEAAVSASRCFEGEDIALTVTIVSPRSSMTSGSTS
jgi:hypothetical protein